MFYNILTKSIQVLCMGFGSWGIWGIGYCRHMGYHCSFPANQVGLEKILWGIRGYGLPGLWVRRVSTVQLSLTMRQERESKRLVFVFEVDYHFVDYMEWGYCVDIEILNLTFNRGFAFRGRSDLAN